MNHTLPVFIPHGKNTIAYFSLQQPKQLIVFVHGFNGNATETWDDFPLLLRKEARFSNADIAFYGYDSLKGQVNNNAVRFYRFLTEMAVCDPNAYGYNRDKNFAPGYEKIIIVAHSLGAVVVRRALLEAKSGRENWLPKVKMILFAPAHRGAKIQALVSESLSGWWKLVAGLGFFVVPVLDDLRPESITIRNLISDSETYLTRGEGQFTIAGEVIWANNERIVHNEKFCQDPTASVIDGKGHMKVCKPNAESFNLPMEILINHL